MADVREFLDAAAPGGRRRHRARPGGGRAAARPHPAPAIRSTGSPRASARCWGSWPRGARTRRSRALVVSDGAVEKHVSNIFSKLDLRARRGGPPARARGADVAGGVAMAERVSVRAIWMVVGRDRCRALRRDGHAPRRQRARGRGGDVHAPVRGGRRHHARGARRQRLGADRGRRHRRDLGHRARERRAPGHRPPGSCARARAWVRGGDLPQLPARTSAGSTTRSGCRCRPTSSCRAGGGVDVSTSRGDVDVATDHGDLSIERIEGDAEWRPTTARSRCRSASPPERVDGRQRPRRRRRRPAARRRAVLRRGRHRPRQHRRRGAHRARRRPRRCGVSDHGDVTVRYPVRVAARSRPHQGERRFAPAEEAGSHQRGRRRSPPLSRTPAAPYAEPRRPTAAHDAGSPPPARPVTTPTTIPPKALPCQCSIRPPPTSPAPRGRPSSSARDEGLRRRRHRGAGARRRRASTCPPGRFTAIMGPSGSGKSTLHALPRRARHPHLGPGVHRRRRARHALRQAAHPAAPRPHRLRLPVVQPGARRSTRVENITLPMRARRAASPTGGGSTRGRATVGCGDRLDHRPSELSGGQQQRVAVARALASRPGVVFADEPTGNLDSRSGAEILGFLRRAVDELGQTIVMVTHDPVAAGYADGVAVPGRRPDRRPDGRARPPSACSTA